MAQLSIETVETGKVLCISLAESDGDPLAFTQEIAKALSLIVGETTKGGHRYLLSPTEDFPPIVGIVHPESTPPTIIISL